MICQNRDFFIDEKSSEDSDCLKDKHEILNTKHETNDFPKSFPRKRESRILVPRLRVDDIRMSIVSNFDIRISSFLLNGLT